MAVADITTTWAVIDMVRNVEDGGVFKVVWWCRVEDPTSPHRRQDGAHMVFEKMLTPDPASDSYTPYENLTNEQVLGWVTADQDKAAIEAALYEQCVKKTEARALIANGLPWLTSLTNDEE
jgi:hypothetical protein